MIHRRAIISLVFLWAILHGSSHAQLVSDLPDSLQAPQELDTTYINSLLRYGNKILYTNPPKAEKLFLWTVDLADSLGDLRLKGSGLYGAGIAYTLLGKSSESIELMDSAGKVFLARDDRVRYYHSEFM